MYTDLLLFFYFLFTILAARHSSFYLSILTGCFIYSQIVTSHNYFHRRDNFRMYGINLSGADYTSWRITHVLSHHIYTNSYLDVEVSFMEPFLQWIPRSKTTGFKFFTVIISPLFYGLCCQLQSFLGMK
jgi:hypothetical protein